MLLPRHDLKYFETLYISGIGVLAARDLGKTSGGFRSLHRRDIRV